MGVSEEVVVLNVSRERGGVTRVRWTSDVGSSHTIKILVLMV